jgi:hypothetical protein
LIGERKRFVNTFRRSCDIILVNTALSKLTLGLSQVVLAMEKGIAVSTASSRSIAKSC